MSIRCSQAIGEGKDVLDTATARMMPLRIHFGCRRAIGMDVTGLQMADFSRLYALVPKCPNRSK